MLRLCVINKRVGVANSGFSELLFIFVANLRAMRPCHVRFDRGLILSYNFYRLFFSYRYDRQCLRF